MKKTFLVLAAGSLSLAVTAQDTTKTKTLDPIVVTAQKFPLKTSQTGKVVLVITREELARSGGKNLSQVLNEQAGLYINGANSNPGKDKSVYLRGARVDHTLITIDGIPVYDPSGIGGNFDIRNLAPENIERIEILKGSQSTLYGSDAIAGVINIILRKESADKIRLNGMASYGSNQTGRSNLFLEGKKKILSYYAGYSREDSRGINESVSKSGDRDSYHQQSRYGGLSLAAGKNLSLQPFFRYTTLTGDLDQGAFTDELDYTYVQKNTQAGIKNTWKKARTTLNLLYSYQKIQRTYTDDSTRSRNGFSIYEQGSYSGQEHFADLYAHISLTQYLDLTVGTDYRFSQSNQSYLSLSNWGPYTARYGADSLRQQQRSLYASGLWRPARGFSVEAGGRVNHHSGYGNNSVANFNPSFLWQNRVKFFGNLSSGYRTPSLYQLFSEYGNRNLKPESAVTGEAGLMYFSPGRLMTARLTFFRRTVRNVIFFYFNPTTYASEYINQDRQDDQGSEIELTITPKRFLHIRFFYSYVDGQLRTKVNEKDTTYFNLLRRPKNSLGLQATADIGSRVTLSTHLAGYGRRWDAYYDASTFQTVQTELKPYLLWDLYGSYRIHKHLKVFADLRNITNSRFTEVSGFNALRFNAYGGIVANW